MNSLSPARHPTETFPNYQARRKLVHKRVAQLLGGKWFHKAVEVFHAPLPGVDNGTDACVSRGELIVVSTDLARKIRLAKSKGVTYRRTEPKPKRIGFLRRQARRSAA